MVRVIAADHLEDI